MNKLIMTATMALLCFLLAGEEVCRLDFSKNYQLFWISKGGFGKPHHNTNIGRSPNGAVGFIINPDCPILKSFMYVVECPAVSKKTYQAVVHTTGEKLGKFGYATISLQALDGARKIISGLPGAEMKLKEIGKDGHWSKLEIKLTIPDKEEYRKIKAVRCLFGVRNMICGNIFFDDLKITTTK